MNVLDLNEFSDHCPIEFALDYINILYQKVDCLTYEKIIWNSENQEYFHTVLQENQNKFDEICSNLTNDMSDVDTCVNDLSSIIHKISIQTNGKTVKKTIK